MEILSSWYDYYFGTPEVREFKHKIIVVGANGTGKKSFIYRFGDNEYFHSYSNTNIGVDFVTETKRIGNDIYKLQFWDLAGNEKFSQTHKSYYNDTTAILVMVDATNPDSLDTAKLWKQNIDQNFTALKFVAETDPIILLVSKIDLLDEDTRSNLNYKDFCETNGFSTWIPMSNKTGENVELVDMLMINICKNVVNNPSDKEL
jgi:Ras-related protein Rab-32